MLVDGPRTAGASTSGGFAAPIMEMIIPYSMCTAGMAGSGYVLSHAK